MRGSGTASTATRDALVHYARKVARLPAFPSEPVLSQPRLQEDHGAKVEMLPTVLKSITTDSIPGEVLPRSRDTWFALMPFDDLTKDVPESTKHDLISKRRTFVVLLVKLATSRSRLFRWDASTMDCGESSSSSSDTNSFWIDLMRALYPESMSNVCQDLTRHLIAMSTKRSPQFLLCVTRDAASGDFPALLEQFLMGSSDTDDDIRALPSVSEALEESLPGPVVIDIGLSFTKGKISRAFMAKLLDVLDHNEQSQRQRNVRFRVVALRFGHKCTYQASVMALLEQPTTRLCVPAIRLGALAGIKPAALRLGLTKLLSEEVGLTSLGVASDEGFKAVSSILRSKSTSISELDVALESTIENAVWLAFGLFHADSKSTVTSLRVRPPPETIKNKNPAARTREWLYAFRRVLRSSTAECDLADIEYDESSPSESDPVRRFVKLRVGAAIKSAPYGGAKRLGLVDDQDDEFEMIATVGDSVAVIVPGLGVGWVPAASISTEQSLPSRIHQTKGMLQTNGKITRLVWDAVDLPQLQLSNHVDMLLDLLAIVGGPLESLHLPLTKWSTTLLTRILPHCPNLTELNVSGHRMTSIAPLRDAYASGTCKISSLSIARSDTKLLNSDTTVEMSAILRGPGRNVLRRVAIQLLPQSRMTESEVASCSQAAQALADLASQSPVLEFIQLPGSAEFEVLHTTSRADHGSSEGLAHVQAPAIDLSAQPFCFAPMPRRSKLAFLSCLNQQASSSPMHRLDARVVSLIFRFGVPTFRRRAILDAPLIHEQLGFTRSDLPTV